MADGKFAVREHPEVRARKLNQLARDVASSGNAADHAAAAAAAAAQAIQKASEALASANASTASATSAQNYSVSAQGFSQSAQTSATDATAGADAAALAQSLAEQARNDAQGAFTAADNAADAAIAAANESAVSVVSAAGHATSAAGFATITEQRATEAELYASSATAAANIAAIKSDASNASAIASSITSTASQVSADESGISAAAAYQSELNAAVSSGASGASAAAAATSAASAAASETAAGNSASSASTSATNAATSAGTASTAASNASTSASQASTSATNAAGSESAAATSATNAATSAGAAGGSASAAATSASSAASSSTAAGNSATAAETSRLAAEAANTSANTAASAASSSAASASSSAATATTQAALSATFAGTAQSAAQQSYPTTFENGFTFFGGNGGVSAPYNDIRFVTDATYGPAAEHNIPGYSWGAISWKSRKPNTTSKKWKVRALVRKLAGADNYVDLRVEYFDKANNDGTARLNYQGVATANISSTTPVWVEADFNAPLNYAFVGPEVVLWGEATVAGSRQQCLALELIDITESTSAASSASVATSQAATATAAAAAAQASMVLTASLATGHINRNSGFDDFPSAAVGSVPANWGINPVGTSGGYRVADPQGGYAYRLPGGAGIDNYTACEMRHTKCVEADAWYVWEADWILNSGTNAGVGSHIVVTDSGQTPLNTYNMSMQNEVGLGTAGKTYSIRKLFQLTSSTGAYGFYLYAMSHWAGAGSIAAANDITWLKCGIRAATPAEIRDQTVLAPLQASVATHSAAIVDLEGRTEAFWQVEAVAGGRAQLRVYADANGGGGVDIVGDVKIDGDLLVTGTVTSNELAANSASLSNYVYNAGSFALSTSWQDAAQVTLAMIGGAAKIEFAAFVGGKAESSGSSVQWRLLRGVTEIRAGTLCLLPGEQTVYGGAVGENPYPVYTPITGMFPAFHLDTSGESGSVTYKIQVKLSTALVDFADISERVLTVTELRR